MGGIVESVGEAVGGVVEGVTGAVSGAVGGLFGGGKQTQQAQTQFQYDPALTQAMIDINQQMADIGTEKWQQVQEIYGPYERAMVQVNQSLLPHIQSISSYTMQEQMRDLQENRPLKDKLRQFQAEGIEFQRRSLERGEQLERQFLEEATKPVDVEQRVGRARRLAGADVEQTFAQAAGQRAREMGRLGIDPSQAQSQAAQREISLAKAAAKAGALTTAEQQERQLAEQQQFGRLATAQQLQRGLGMQSLAGVGSLGGTGTQQLGNFQLGASAGQALSALGQAQSGIGALAGRQEGQIGTTTTPTPSPFAQLAGTFGGSLLSAYGGGLGAKLVG